VSLGRVGCRRGEYAATVAAPVKEYLKRSIRGCGMIGEKRGRAGVTARPWGYHRKSTVVRGKVGEFGRAVYCENVKKLELHRHGRNASVSVGTVTGNSA